MMPEEMRLEYQDERPKNKMGHWEIVLYLLSMSIPLIITLIGAIIFAGRIEPVNALTPGQLTGLALTAVGIVMLMFVKICRLERELDAMSEN